MPTKRSTPQGVVSLTCLHCSTVFTRGHANANRRKTARSAPGAFCSRSCFVAYQNPHKFSGAYAIVHIPTGRMYVGSSVNIQSRWKTHRTELRRGVHNNQGLQGTWNLDGPDAFGFHVIERADGRIALLAAEQRALDANRGHLFNINPTAGSALGAKLAPDVVEAMRQRLKGRAISPEQRAKQSAAMKGRKWPPSRTTWRKVPHAATSTDDRREIEHLQFDKQVR